MQHNRSIERVQRLLDSAVWLGGSERSDDEIPTSKHARLQPRASIRTPGPLPRPALRRADTLVRLRLHQQMAREVLQVVGTREAHTTQPGTVIQRALARTVAQ